MSKPSEIKYFIRYNNSAYGINIVNRCFGRYYMTIRKVSDNSAVIYNSANEVDVMRALRVYGALNDPAVSIMFPHWRVEEEEKQEASDS